MNTSVEKPHDQTPAKPAEPGRNAMWVREELVQLLSLSATLAGLCITGVTLIQTTSKASMAQTVADDVLASSSLLFLLTTYIIFFALRTRKPKLAERLERVADGLFLVALTGMVLCGFIMVYAIW
ncbi:hypothetical protein [Ideonella margarita]|uniref:Uncharacterized protein n=1 Tax=Ideonella margarita TaxID=2984191 RepID=A0ABU9C7E2_9BURK